MKYEGVIKGRGTERGRNKMKAELANKVVVLDEASLASTKEVRRLGTLAKELQFRVVMIGDARQQGGVEVGKPFYYLQEHGMDTAIMRDVKRQEEARLLQAVYKAEKTVDNEVAGKHIYEASGDRKVRNVRRDLREQVEEFLSRPYLVKDVAISEFGSNTEIKKRGDTIRFGRKGSIVANIREGIWYDFERGEGGGLFKFYKKEMYDGEIGRKRIVVEERKGYDVEQSREEKIRGVIE